MAATRQLMKDLGIPAFGLALLFAATASAAQTESAGGKYEATWKSLDSRPVASWWRDAKFGIFIHWGPYAVPAYAPVRADGKFDWDGYAEWYQGKLIVGKGPFLKHHAEKHHNAPYGNFAAEFKARDYNPREWARLFKKAGARYVVLTSKHHDGYALWPSPEQPYYNAKALGPGRDLARMFCDAMRAEGLKRGFYFSMLEYANPLYPGKRDSKTTAASLDIREWNRRVNIPQLKELVNNYEADIIWPDGEWDYTSGEHGVREFLAWLFNESKMKDSVVVNDRWGSDCRGRHGGHYTTEYALEGGDTSGGSDVHPWEECRGIGGSFGYNAEETPVHYMTRERCIETLVSCVSRGGNLLLNVGPDADGRIPAIQQDRLLAMGAWLDVNGEAIYGSRAWKGADPARRSERIYFTEKTNAVYMFVFDWPKAGLLVDKPGNVKKVTLLGLDRELPFKVEGTGVRADTSSITPADLPGAAPWVFRFERF